MRGRAGFNCGKGLGLGLEWGWGVGVGVGVADRGSANLVLEL